MYLQPNLTRLLETRCAQLPRSEANDMLKTLEAFTVTRGIAPLFASAFGGVGAPPALAPQAQVPGQIPAPRAFPTPGGDRIDARLPLPLGDLVRPETLGREATAAWGQNSALCGGAAGVFPNAQTFFAAVAQLGVTLQGLMALGGLAAVGQAAVGAHRGPAAPAAGQGAPAAAQNAQNTQTTAPVAHAGLPVRAPGTGKEGKGANFPKAGDGPFLQSLTQATGKVKKKRKRKLKALNISGKRDVKVVNKGIQQLKGAEPAIALAKPGDKAGPGKLVLDQATVTAIRNAPDQAAAEAVLRNAISGQTGKKLGTANMHDRRAIKHGANREVLNALLGTNIRAGHEKNSASSLVLNEMVGDITRSIRGGTFGSTVINNSYARQYCGDRVAGAYGFGEGDGLTSEVQNPPAALSIDLNAYKAAANTMGELGSPLIFDLTGMGLKLKNGGLTQVDLDGDGRMETITELDAHIGMLVFDSKTASADADDNDGDDGETSGRDMFGNNTDLSAYGIRGSEENGSFANGFDALRALCEHFELIHGDKQHLDAADLAFLEREVGLAMRVGGVVDGEDQSFAQIGITRINLGDPTRIQSIKDAEVDAYGNRLMKQEGATFLVHGVERHYCDIWFNIIAREADVAPATQRPAQSAGPRRGLPRTVMA